MGVINNMAEAQHIASRYRVDGLVVGLCHGCFDIVHIGHIHHLKQARERVDRLFVSVTADSFVNKGPDRPIFSEQRRVAFISSIRYCDHAIINMAATAEFIISAIQPHIFFKGADYESSEDLRVQTERVAIEQYGGEIALTDDDMFDSTSRIAQIVTTLHA